MLSEDSHVKSWNQWLQQINSEKILVVLLKYIGLYTHEMVLGLVTLYSGNIGGRIKLWSIFLGGSDFQKINFEKLL
jgi:hypothetical protein